MTGISEIGRIRHMSNIRSLLAQGKVVLVTFEKADGSMRTMICTQNSERIPKNAKPRTQMQYDSRQIRVFDLVADEWRSMIEQRIVKVEEYRAKVA